MITQREYEVLRLIEHNRICYVSTDVVEGATLTQWIQCHPNITKKQFMYWIHRMIKQLVQIHKCRGNPCYQYVNPYSLIVTENEELYFLNMRAESNKDIVRFVEKNNIRKIFYPEMNKVSKSDMKTDIYSFGKTVQYILAFAEIRPQLTRNEERKLKKMIEKCLNMHSRNRFKEITEVEKYIQQ